MSAQVPFQLSRGVAGPIQQSPVTCGSAALTVARMLVSPAFGRWVVSGIGRGVGSPDPRSEQDRFAEYERIVMSRTNGVRPAEDRWNIPWAHALGTPPWGAKAELEHGAARPGAGYRMRLVRLGSTNGLRDVHRDLVHHVRQGEPALLYIGDAWLPRHVTLVLPGDDEARINVYDPASGSVTELALETFETRRLDIAGWNVPWITVRPR